MTTHRFFQLLITLACWPVWFSSLSAADANELFFRGNIELKEGRAESALEHYLAAAEQGTSAALEFNTGHAFLQLEQPAMALLHWYRAALLDPQQPDILHNINWILSQQQLQTFSAPAWQQWFPPFGLTLYLRLTTLFLLVALALLLLPAVAAKANIVSKTLGWLCLVPALLAAVGIWSQRPDTALALVVANNATLRVAPTSGSPGTGELPAGSHIRILEAERSFRLITTPDNRTGFLHENEIQRILP